MLVYTPYGDQDWDVIWGEISAEGVIGGMSIEWKGPEDTEKLVEFLTPKLPSLPPNFLLDLRHSLPSITPIQESVKSAFPPSLLSYLTFNVDCSSILLKGALSVAAKVIGKKVSGLVSQGYFSHVALEVQYLLTVTCYARLQSSLFLNPLTPLPPPTPPQDLQQNYHVLYRRGQVRRARINRLRRPLLHVQERPKRPGGELRYLGSNV